MSPLYARSAFLLFLLICSPLLLPLQSSAQTHPATLSFDEVYSGFSSPIAITHADDGSNRLFVVERAGRIKIIEDSVTLAGNFLDINTNVLTSSERGLLGLAFHPDYQDNGYFFVHYINAADSTVISRFTVSAGDPNDANEASEEIILRVDQPAGNHNGGTIKFGPDGYLYIALGDGGNTPQYSQDPSRLLGKVLRLDIDNGLPYTIPGTNPYVGVTFPDTLDEIWAFGLRNPFRWSFDRLTGDLWIADVGQNSFEEVNFTPAGSMGGENYGWRCYEANNTFNTSGCGPMSSYQFPVFNYAHGVPAASICGGYVYRGANQCLYGVYIVADTRRDEAWTLVPTGGGNFSSKNFGSGVPADIVGFGEDEAGELYCVSISDGNVYQLNGTQLTVNQNPIPSNTYTATDILKSSGTVNSSGDVTFKSSEAIILMPQFEVQLGGILTGEIGCDN